MGIIFVKTPKGVAEIEQRGGGLTPRVRRVLIMLDGKRTDDDIRAMALVDDLEQTLGMLVEAGYIESQTQPEAVAAATATATGAGIVNTVTFREVQDEPDPKEMEMAKNYIMNTLKTFCGPMSHLSIYEAVHAAKTHEELRAQFVPWYNAITLTRDGRRRAEDLCADLLKVI